MVPRVVTQLVDADGVGVDCAPWRSTLIPLRKNVAGTPCLAKVARTWGVQSGIGPSSNVRATRLRPVGPDQSTELPGADGGERSGRIPDAKPP